MSTTPLTCALDNGDQRALLCLAVLVGNDSVKLSTRQRRLVYAHSRTHILGEHEPLNGMGKLLPSPITAQKLLVGTLKLVTLDVIRSLERTCCNRVRIQGILLKKRQTQPSAVSPGLPTASPCCGACRQRLSNDGGAHEVLCGNHGWGVVDAGLSIEAIRTKVFLPSG